MAFFFSKEISSFENTFDAEHFFFLNANNNERGEGEGRAGEGRGAGGKRNDVGKECGVSLFGWIEEMRKNEALNLRE